MWTCVGCRACDAFYAWLFAKSLAFVRCSPVLVVAGATPSTLIYWLSLPPLCGVDLCWFVAHALPVMPVCLLSPSPLCGVVLFWWSLVRSFYACLLAKSPAFVRYGPVLVVDCAAPVCLTVYFDSRLCAWWARTTPLFWLSIRPSVFIFVWMGLCFFYCVIVSYD